MTQPVKDGTDKIQRWERALKRVETCEQQLNSAECELTNATSDLGRWLTPADAEVDEQFSVWYGSQLLTVKKVRYAFYTVSLRKGRKV